MSIPTAENHTTERITGSAGDLGHAEPGHRVVCSGSFELPMEPDRVFPLFTPLGEIDWVPGWNPRFVHPADGTLERDQVFVTGEEEAAELTLWSVVRVDEPAREAEYLRITPGSRLGRVAVAVLPEATGSRVEVTYCLTALYEEAEELLAEFAAGYDEMLHTWQRLTREYLEKAA